MSDMEGASHAAKKARVGESTDMRRQGTHPMASPVDVLKVADKIFKASDCTENTLQEIEMCVTCASVVSHIPGPVPYSRQRMVGGEFTSLLDAKGVLSDDGSRKWGDETYVLLHGVTRVGNSVLLIVRGFRPFQRFLVPNNVEAKTLVDWLTDAPGEKKEFHERMGINTASVEFEEDTAERAWGYDPTGERRLVTLRFNAPGDVYRCRKNFEDPDKFNPIEGVEMEVRIDPMTQFTSQTGVKPCQWLKAGVHKAQPGDTWDWSCASLRPSFGSVNSKISHCALEFDVGVRSIELVLDEKNEPLSDIPDQLIWSFDGEMYSKSHGFPDKECDEDLTVLITMEAKWMLSERSVAVALALGVPERPVDTSVVSGEVFVLCFPTEREVIEAMATLIRMTTPQKVIGFNSMGFDIPWLAEKAKRTRAVTLFCCGHIVLEKARVDTKSLDSGARGNNDMTVITWSGINQIDIMKEVQARYKMESYSLNSCCEKFLDGMQKIDLGAPEMFDLFEKGETARLIEYGLLDAELPRRLLEVLFIVASLFELARVTGTTIEWLVMRGQQIKIMTMLFLFAKRNRLFLNEPLVKTLTGYKGATVIEPDKNFYLDPVATMDFASLYPSTPTHMHTLHGMHLPLPSSDTSLPLPSPGIMMAHNLCFSTLVVDKFGNGGAPTGTHELPSGKVVEFVTPEVKKGVLPRMLQEILHARKVAKKSKKNAKTPMEATVMDQRQLALKVSANSIYGFCAAQMYPCLVISEVVTNKGREMIDDTRRMAEGPEVEAAVRAELPELYERLPDFKPRTVYGDTDSVMVLCPGATVDECWKWGVIAARVITEYFPGRVLPCSRCFADVPFRL